MAKKVTTNTIIWGSTTIEIPVELLKVLVKADNPETLAIAKTMAKVLLSDGDAIMWGT